MANPYKPAIEWRDVESVTPYIRNTKIHPTEQVDKIAGSIAEFGWDQPIVVDGDGVIIKGHGRREAALRLGIKQVPVVVRTDLTPSQVKAARIADNKVAESPWDTSMLSLEALELKDAEFDLSLLGFGDDELDALLNPEVGPTEGLTDSDAVPENVGTRCKPGDLWVFGGHRLLCGDSTNVQHVERLMGGEKADMVFTDPPYGIALKPTNVGGLGDKHVHQKIIGDETTDVAREAYHVFGPWPCIQVVWGGNYFTDFLPVNGHWIVWNKMAFDKPAQTFSHCEIAWTNVPKASVRMYSHIWDGAFRQGSKKDEAESRLHPAQKPVGLICSIFSDLDGELVFEPFTGSGSTLIACEKTSRRCFGMEIDPKYCDVILSRWEAFTGKTAVLDA